MGKKKKNTARDFPGSPEKRLHPSTVVGAGSIPGQETKIPHATVQPEKEKRKKKPTMARVLPVYQTLTIWTSR